MLYPVELRTQLAKHTPRSLTNIGHFVDKTTQYYSEKYFKRDRSDNIISYLLWRIVSDILHSVMYFTKCIVRFSTNKKTRPISDRVLKEYSYDGDIYQ